MGKKIDFPHGKARLLSLARFHTNSFERRHFVAVFREITHTRRSLSLSNYVEQPRFVFRSKVVRSRDRFNFENPNKERSAAEVQNAHISA